MIRVYVAGPIGANDEGRAARVQAAVDAGLELLRAGLYPFVPHLWAASTPHADAVQDYESWMRYDFFEYHAEPVVQARWRVTW